MFEQFPYTNLHELNLDWIIEKVKEAYGPDNPPTNVVLSVDGQTGNVQVFPNAVIRLPDVSAGTWNFYRMANGISRGIQFTPNGVERIEGSTRLKLYDENNVPVKSVNGLTGEVELFTDALIRLPDILAETWNVRRTANGTSRGIQFTPNGAERIEGTNRYLMYDSSNLPKTVDDRDVPIMEIALPSDTTTWGFTRQLEDGSNTTIYLQKSGDSVKAYISYISEDDQTSVTLPLLTTADIPTSAGVVSINGQTGVVTLDGTQIYTYPNSNITINQALAELTNALNAVEDAIAIVANGDTHPAIASGQFVYVKNHYTLANGLYKATSAIATNGTLSTANLTADGAGGLNALNDELSTLITNINTWESVLTDSTSITGATVRIYKNIGLKLGIIRVNGSGTNTPTGRYTINYPANFSAKIDSLISPVYISTSGANGYIEAGASSADINLRADSTWCAGHIMFPIN